MTGWLFVLPQLVLVAALVLLPLGRVIYLSFMQYDGFTDPVFIGLQNYLDLIVWKDFQRQVLNTFLLVLALPLWVLLPFTLAALSHDHPRKAWLRFFFLLPGILPAVVVGMIFRMVLSDRGPANELLRALGLPGVPWLSNDPLVLATVALVIAWGMMGSGVMFYSAGLSALPRERVEAAILDGANWWDLVRHIYWPATIPVTRFWSMILVLATVTTFYPWIVGLTRGGPGIASSTIDHAVFLAGMGSSRLGLAAAMAVVGVLAIIVILGLVTQLSPKERG
jgi:ABC-type sugar transport system permease subunit